MLDVVMMIGLDRGTFDPCIASVDSSSGEPATDGPLGDDVRDRDRCIAEVDFEAMFASAAARSG